MNLTSDDWERLQTLRQLFLQDASTNYWKSDRDLELYDLIYAQRISWKWDTVLQNLTTVGWQPTAQHIIDWGCGTGIASRTVAPWSGIKDVSLFDQSHLAQSFAKEKLTQDEREVSFLSQEETLEKNSLLLMSHVVSELHEEELLELARKAAVADEVIWVEPGSREVSRKLGSLRNIFQQAGHHLIAPCVHENPCPMLDQGREGDWCHFFAKPPLEIFQSSFWHDVSHKLGIDLRSLPYSYLAFSRHWKPSYPPSSERLIAHPRELKAHCKLLCCGKEGLKDRTLQRRDNTTLFRSLIKHQRAGVFEWEEHPSKESYIIGEHTGKKNK